MTSEFFLAPSLTSVYSAKNGGKYFFWGKGVLINMFFLFFWRGEDGRSKKCEGWRWVTQKMGG